MADLSGIIFSISGRIIRAACNPARAKLIGQFRMEHKQLWGIEAGEIHGCDPLFELQ
jgi:hypothetical protein